MCDQNSESKSVVFRMIEGVCILVSAELILLTLIHVNFESGSFKLNIKTDSTFN